MLSSTLKTKTSPLVRGLCHKSKLPEKKVYQWPYEKYPYNLLTRWWDPFTEKKFNENTKVIQIEGNIACGKQDFAKRLAHKLGMKVIPVPELESYYINDHGYDYCALNPLLPERMRLCNWKMFHENPARHSSIHLLFFSFKLRFYQYVQALQHLFNTGQGVVLVRSAFTHRALVESMHELGWLPMGYLRGDGFKFYDWRHFYINFRNESLRSIPKPHLTIYLDTPVDTCMKKIKASDNSMIANSKALTPEYLEGIEKAYNEIVLPRQDYHSHILRVPHPERLTDEEMMDVVDEIEDLDFNYDFHHTRFESWDPTTFHWHSNMRAQVTSSQVVDLTDMFWVPDYDIAGLGDSITQVDLKLRKSLFEGHVGKIGHLRKLDQDQRFVPWYSRIFPRRDFKTQMDEYFRTDFV